MATAATMPLYCLDTTAPDGAWTSEAAASSTPVVGASIAESSAEVSEGFEFGCFRLLFVFFCLSRWPYWEVWQLEPSREPLSDGIGFREPGLSSPPRRRLRERKFGLVYGVSLSLTVSFISYAAFSLNAVQGILWRFGGLSSDGVTLSTTVLASGPAPTWVDTVVGCEAGYTG
jgi:hypothetical protein